MFDARSRVTPGPRRPAPPAPRQHHAPLLQLQATAGNAAVGQLLAVQRENAVKITADELTWTDDVLSDPFIGQMFKLYGGQNEVILRRVKSLGAATTEGVASGNEISIADATYAQQDVVAPRPGEAKPATREEEFKLTFIHELFHFFANRVQDGDVPRVAAPAELKDVMLNPHENGLPPATFGWFIHPETLNYLHFDIGATSNLTAKDYVPPESFFGQIRTSGKWEHSPFPQSSENVDVEEDLATTVAMFLASPASRQRLKDEFPMRFNLMARYFGKVLPKAVAEKLAG